MMTRVRAPSYTETVATTEQRMSIQRACIARLGVHRGAVAAARVAQWAMTTADLGRVPTTVEYSEWWAVTERTGWNHRALVHEALGEDWPTVVERVAEVVAAKKLRSPRAVQQLALI